MLDVYKWCNVRRMDDRVSRWLDAQWYDRDCGNRTLILAATVARFINWPPALEEYGTPFRSWRYGEFVQKLTVRHSVGQKVFTGAYIINGSDGGSKIETVARMVQRLAGVMPNANGKPIIYQDIKGTWQALRHHAGAGMGSFMAGQVVADMAAVRPSLFANVATWAPIGPGSQRGMNRLLGNDINKRIDQDRFENLLATLIDTLGPRIRQIWDDRKLVAMDIQNCLCEFDKYRRLQRQEGSVRSKYTPWNHHKQNEMEL